MELFTGLQLQLSGVELSNFHYSYLQFFVEIQLQERSRLGDFKAFCTTLRELIANSICNDFKKDRMAPIRLGSVTVRRSYMDRSERSRFSSPQVKLGERGSSVFLFSFKGKARFQFWFWFLKNGSGASGSDGSGFRFQFGS